MVDEVLDQKTPEPQRPTLPVGSESDLLGIAQSLGISLEVEEFPYRDPQATADFLNQIRKDNDTKGMPFIALDLRQRYTPDYLKIEGELDDRNFGHSNEVGAVLAVYEKGKISEEDCLSYLAESSLVKCLPFIMKLQELEKSYEGKSWDWLKGAIKTQKDLIDFHYAHYRIYVQLIQKLQENPGLKEKIKPGLIDMGEKVAQLKR